MADSNSVVFTTTGSDELSGATAALTGSAKDSIPPSDPLVILTEVDRDIANLEKRLSELKASKATHVASISHCPSTSYSLYCTVTDNSFRNKNRDKTTIDSNDNIPPFTLPNPQTRLLPSMYSTSSQQSEPWVGPNYTTLSSQSEADIDLSSNLPSDGASLSDSSAIHIRSVGDFHNLCSCIKMPKRFME